MLPLGTDFDELDSVVQREDSSGITVWFSCTDGSFATLFVPFDEVRARSIQVSESTRAPQGVRLQ